MVGSFPSGRKMAGGFPSERVPSLLHNSRKHHHAAKTEKEILNGSNQYFQTTECCPF